MAHHQHHGGHIDAHSFHTLHAHASPTMPAISEDEVIPDTDEPPELPPSQFQKTRPAQPARRESLLTQSLLSESESHNEQERERERFTARQPSRSSTCSTFSDHSHPFTSDDGLISPSTRASTPGSPPRSNTWFRKRSVKEPSAESTPLARSRTPSVGTPHVIHNSPESSEPTVEATLGRKRCITFACGKKEVPKPKEVEVAPKAEEKKEEPAPARKPCTIKFACAFTKCSSKTLDKNAAPRVGRHSSPAPRSNGSSKPSSPTVTRRSHRDSDTTIKNESPKSVRKSPMHLRRPSNDPDLGKSEATRFHEFASSEDESQDWTQERTVYKNRLTVNDTLKKETEIRNLHESADEEALEEEQEKAELELLEDDDDDEDDDEDELSDSTDDGFQTDDEDGFAQSDDDDDDDNSDYEWWAPRGRTTDRSPAPARMLPLPVVHPSISGRSGSISSARSGSSNPSPSAISRRRTQPVKIRPSSPELPDSTDFVCGTLDEDRPMEQAFMNNLIQRKAAKHRPTPQDIDPTFPTSDPEMDEEDDDDVVATVVESAVEQSDANNYIQGGFENLHGDPAPHRRRPSPAPLKRVNSNRLSPPRHKSPAPLKRVNSNRLSPPRHKSPAPLRRVTSNRQNSPKRLKSPAPIQRTNSHKVNSPKRRASPAPANMTNTRGRSPAPKRGRSPAPKALFDTTSRRVLSPPTEHRPRSPPPSRRGSETVSPNVVAIPFGTAFLGHRPQLTHTSSLPRHGHGFARRMASLSAHRKERRRTPAAPVKDDAIFEEDNEEDEGETTARDDIDGPYTRGAIDIVQGLERKRLRRRQKFMEKYQRKEDKKRARGEVKRPKPGQGAQRMRQIGLDCAVYHGKRVLSV